MEAERGLNSHVQDLKCTGLSENGGKWAAVNQNNGVWPPSLKTLVKKDGFPRELCAKKPPPVG